MSVEQGRKILSLEERVQAIREFEKVPVYQKVADIMGCSYKQIRNIILNRDAILLYYASKTGHCEGSFAKRDDRQAKIDLLNRVMYEWIQRTQSRKDVGRISTKLIRTIALDVKNHIKIPGFYPNTDWLDNFIHEYNMIMDDLVNQTIYARCSEPKQHLSLKISDIVEHIQNTPRETSHSIHNPYIESDVVLPYEYKKDDSPLMFEYNDSNSQYIAGHDQEQYSDKNSNCDVPKPSQNKRLREEDGFESPPKQEDDSEKLISSYEEAIKHLRPLEDFVLLEENYRAMGVISQLENILRNSKNKTN